MDLLALWIYWRYGFIGVMDLLALWKIIKKKGKKMEDRFIKDYGIGFNDLNSIAKKIAGIEIKKTVNANIGFDDLYNSAWIGILIGLKSYDKEKNVKVYTHAYNNAYYEVYAYIRKNFYSVYVPWVAHTDKITGYNKNEFKRIDNKYKKLLDDDKITNDKYNSIKEDIKRELKFKDFSETKECYTENGFNFSSNDCVNDLQNRNLFKVILRNMYDEGLLNLNDLKVIKAYYEDSDKKQGFKSALNKMQKYAKDNKEIYEDLKDMYNNFGQDSVIFEE